MANWNQSVWSKGSKLHMPVPFVANHDKAFHLNPLEETVDHNTIETRLVLYC
jgi:hypothetical protein